MMNLLTYKTVKEFWNENKEFLLEKEPISQLIIASALPNLEEEIRKDLFFGVIVDENNEGILGFSNVNPYNLVIYSPKVDGAKKAIYLLIDYLIKENIAINGVNANEQLIPVFTEYYTKKTGLELEEHFSMDIMEAKVVKYNDLVPGYFRGATLEDLSMLTKWQLNFSDDIDNSKIAYEQAEARTKELIESNDIFIYEDENHVPVSTASAARKLTKGIVISRVYTPKEYRCKGFSTACIDNITRHYLSKAEYCTLFVEKNNPFSNSVYRKVGYVVMEANYDYRVKKA